jgi:hypothetical protein
MTERKLGLRPPKNAPALMLAPLLTKAVPEYPPTGDHFSNVTDWGLYDNDKYGDCGPTSVANYIKLVTRYLTGTEISVTQDDVFDLYRRSGNPNFDPATDADDNGVDMQTMLEALAKGGIGGGHKPVAFAKVNAGNLDEVRAAIAIFGGVLLGVNLEVAQQTQTDDGGPWDYDASGTWGGHAVVAGRYTSASTGTDVSVVTWAEVMGTTDAFLKHQLGECWVVVLPEHLQNPAFLAGVDVAMLAADYQALTGRPFPVQPTPAPTPTDPPGPGPDPLVDADVELAKAFRADGWVSRRHSGDNADVAEAAAAWLQAKSL